MILKAVPPASFSPVSQGIAPIRLCDRIAQCWQRQLEFVDEQRTVASSLNIVHWRINTSLPIVPRSICGVSTVDTRWELLFLCQCPSSVSGKEDDISPKNFVTRIDAVLFEEWTPGLDMVLPSVGFQPAVFLCLFIVGLG